MVGPIFRKKNTCAAVALFSWLSVFLPTSHHGCRAQSSLFDVLPVSVFTLWSLVFFQIAVHYTRNLKYFTIKSAIPHQEVTNAIDSTNIVCTTCLWWWFNAITCVNNFQISSPIFEIVIALSENQISCSKLNHVHWAFWISRVYYQSKLFTMILLNTCMRFRHW